MDFGIFVVVYRSESRDGCPAYCANAEMETRGPWAGLTATYPWDTDYRSDIFTGVPGFHNVAAENLGTPMGVFPIHVKVVSLYSGSYFQRTDCAIGNWIRDPLEKADPKSQNFDRGDCSYGCEVHLGDLQSFLAPRER